MLSSISLLSKDLIETISTLPVIFLLPVLKIPISSSFKSVKESIFSFHWSIKVNFSTRINVFLLISLIKDIANIVLPKAVGATRIPLSFSNITF